MSPVDGRINRATLLIEPSSPIFPTCYHPPNSTKEEYDGKQEVSVHETCDVIVRMRLGETDRQIAKDGLMGRSKASRLRALLVSTDGWNQGRIFLLMTLLTNFPNPEGKQQCRNSLVKPYATQVLQWASLGISGVATHQCLVRDHGFIGAYKLMKRFLQTHQPGPSAMIFLDLKAERRLKWTLDLWPAPDGLGSRERDQDVVFRDDYGL